MDGTPFERYAVYAAPRPNSALAAFARDWLGYDAETGETITPSPLAGLNEDARRAIVKSPARYGFHATLKAPFRLAEDYGEAALTESVDTLAGRLRPPAPASLRVGELGNFIALVPEGSSEALASLAWACVEDLDRLRAPLTDGERQRRLAAGLTHAQRDLLERWGYPFVGAEFRYHMTLTGQLQAPLRETVAEWLRREMQDLLHEAFALQDLCLFGDPGEGGAFRLVRRIPITGARQV